jgi:transcriptional regulator with XRE-family HTH domain
VTTSLIERVRRDAGLSQEVLAARAGTSRTTLSAYEHGRKSPTLATVERLLDGAGFELTAEPVVLFTTLETRRSRPISVPNRLWRLPLAEAFATVTLPIEVNWSHPGRRFSLSDRRERLRCYEVVLQEGTGADLRRFVDGALLLDGWADLVIPRDIRAAWQPIVDSALS